MATVDVIVAVRDEAQRIEPFLAALSALALPEGVELRVVFIEDSSRDGTRAVLRGIAARDASVAYCALERGFGQGPALVYGLSRSQADAAILMDVDGSHPVEVIPQMIEAFLDGAEVVQCVRARLSGRKLYRRAGAALFWAGARVLVGIDLREQNVYYRLVSSSVARRLVEGPRYWRFLRFPLPRAAGALRTIRVDTVERTTGESKYGVWRLLWLGVDGVLELISPARFAALVGGFALLALALGVVGLWPLASLAAAAAAGLVVYRSRLRHSDVLARVRIAESMNMPEKSRPRTGEATPA